MTALSLVCLAAFASAARAADPVSGTWTTSAGGTTLTYVFKLVDQRFTGIVCGPCDDPASVFEIEDGRLTDAGRAVFFVRHDDGPPGRPAPAFRERVEASVARNTMTLSVRSDRDSAGPPLMRTLSRVVPDFELDSSALPAGVAASGGPAASPFAGGHWVSAGRTAQQNWILRVRDGRVWGLVCGPCTPAVVTLLDGRVTGTSITFNINHIDTPPSAARRGIQRNVMTGTLGAGDNGNVMRFTWVSEQAPDRTGEIVMFGPLR